MLADEAPDLILLDVHLPDANGFDLCRQFKAAPTTASAFVLLISGMHVSGEDRVRGLEGGADGYLTKPVEPVEVLAQIKALLRVRRAEEDRQRLRAERDEALARLQTQNERMPLARITFDAEFHITDWNPAAEGIFGFRKEEVLGREPLDLIISREVLARVGEERMRRLRTGDMAVHGVNANVTKDGRTITCEWFNTPLLDADGRFTGLLCLAQDVTERVAAQETLRLRDRAIQAVTQGILITDASRPDDPILYASPGFERLTGYAAPEIVGRNCRFLQCPETDPATVAQVRQAIREGRPCAVEILNHRKDGTHFWNALSISPIMDAEGRVTHFVGVQADITERRRLEAQYLQSQKMEAVGRLAGGVAHDFNNLLTVIQGYGAMLLGSLGPDNPSHELVGEMTRAGERAAALTRQLLAFSRQSVLAPRVLDLNAVVLDLEKMLRRVIGEDIDLAANLGPALGRVKADLGQIEQVLMNLAVNARDAMPTGGKLTIETRNIEVDEDGARRHTGLRPGRYILLAVGDTGHGMTPEVQARIFEPFFTTKEKGKGTGLGLATVHGIVQQAGGHVGVHSRPGAGTTFQVYLPRVEEMASPARPAAGGRAAPKGTETILLVEDEDSVRALTRLVLHGAGYRVLEASDGGEALEVGALHTGPIHLLLSDVVMPVLGGRQLAERLLTLHPEMKVLFQSGYTDDAVVRHGLSQETVHFLQKPFTPAALTQKVREVLDSAG